MSNNLKFKNTTYYGISRRRHPLHKLYCVWTEMRKRCNNPNHSSYKDYGGRGIVICKEWDNSIAFVEWALNNGWRYGLDIDRMNNNDGYFPDNVRFVVRRDNCRNRRPSLTRKLPTGVYKARRRYRVYCQVDGKRYNIGRYDTPEEAEMAYEKFVNSLKRAC